MTDRERTPFDRPTYPPQCVRTERRSLLARGAVLAGMLAALTLIVWLLIAEATSTSGRPSHGPSISSPTAAFPR